MTRTSLLERAARHALAPIDGAWLVAFRVLFGLTFAFSMQPGMSVTSGMWQSWQLRKSSPGCAKLLPSHSLYVRCSLKSTPMPTPASSTRSRGVVTS